MEMLRCSISETAILFHICDKKKINEVANFAKSFEFPREMLLGSELLFFFQSQNNQHDYFEKIN